MNQRISEINLAWKMRKSSRKVSKKRSDNARQSRWLKKAMARLSLFQMLSNLSE